MEGFSSAKRHLNLYQIAFEIDLGRNKGQTLFLDLTPEAFDFLLVNKKTAVSIRDMVEDRALVVGLNRKAD